MPLLRDNDLDHILAEVGLLPPHLVISSLMSGLYHTDEQVKWNTVTVFGQVMDAIARTDMEGARVIMRRILWNLNEESGGIGWGMPEATGEILARNDNLAREFAPVLISYIRPDGNFLEFGLLQRGVLWGIGRLAEVQPQLIQSLGAEQYLRPYLCSHDSSVRGLAAWILGFVGGGESIPHLGNLLQDGAEIKLYKDQKFQIARVRELVSQSLTLIKRRACS